MYDVIFFLGFGEVGQIVEFAAFYVGLIEAHTGPEFMARVADDSKRKRLSQGVLSQRDIFPLIFTLIHLF